MSRKTILNCVRIGVITIVFSTGYICGSLPKQSANADMGSIGSDMLKKASESGGSLGNVAQFGTAISDMQKHVSGLQQNLETFKKVQTALGGK